MKAKRLLIAFLPIIALFIPSCDSSEHSGSSSRSYVEMHVGDIKQYAVVLSGDTVYQNWKILGMAVREDGQVVYRTEWLLNDFEPDNNVTYQPYYNYYFIRDGYFYGTSLVRLEEERFKDNPYDEQRIAKANPLPEETWRRDSDSSDIFKANYIGILQTKAGLFTDVYAFSIGGMGFAPYYAKGYGHIGTAIDNNFEIIQANYVKVGGKEMGSFVQPNKNKKLNKLAAARPAVNYFGQIINYK